MADQTQPNPRPLIEFHAGGHERFPAPYPASRNIPDWYKKLLVEVSTPDEPANRTIKRCAPFLDALSCGYIIPLTADITFTTDAQRNLISNIHGRGVPPAAAAPRLLALADTMRRLRTSGVAVKEEFGSKPAFGDAG